MQGFFRKALVAFTILFCSSTIAADLTVATWNIKRLGHGNQTSYKALAHVAKHADLIAVQEVMNEQGIERFVSALRTATGEKGWSVINSHLVGTRSYKEMYSFVFRDSAVAYEDGAVVYLDRGDRFIREPFSARFRSKQTGEVFALATVHILYGDGISDRTPEILELASYWRWLEDIYPSTPLLLVGDFNLDPQHGAWAALREHAKPLITQGASTLSSINGRYANLYDNAFVSHRSSLPITKTEIINFPLMLGWDHKKSRAHVSDHAPIFITLGRPTNAVALPVVTGQMTRGGSQRAASPVKQIARGLADTLQAKASAGAKGEPNYALFSPYNKVLIVLLFLSTHKSTHKFFCCSIF